MADTEDVVNFGTFVEPPPPVEVMEKTSRLVGGVVETSKHVVTRPGCCSVLPCLKFFFASVISFSSTGLAMYLIVTDRFQNTAISSFAVGLITTNLAFWTEPPKYKT
jgi:hypothetical protein